MKRSTDCSSYITRGKELKRRERVVVDSEARNQDSGRTSVTDPDKIKRTRVSDGVRCRTRLLDEMS